MPSARASRRGAFLNWRFAVNGIQNADCSRSAPNSARLFMKRHYTAQGRKMHAAAQKKKCRHHAIARWDDVGLRRARASAGCVPVAFRLPALLGGSTEVSARARWSLCAFLLLRTVF